MTPRTQDEYLDLIDQAIFEIEDVLMCAEDEGDPEDSVFSDILPVYEKLSSDLKKLHADILQGKHVIGQARISPFMPLVSAWKEDSILDLFAALNYTYKTGFQA
jgi:hypothetical protein